MPARSGPLWLEVAGPALYRHLDRLGTIGGQTQPEVKSGQQRTYPPIKERTDLPFAPVRGQKVLDGAAAAYSCTGASNGSGRKLPDASTTQATRPVRPLSVRALAGIPLRPAVEKFTISSRRSPR